jgi:hypothetical protein
MADGPGASGGGSSGGGLGGSTGEGGEDYYPYGVPTEIWDPYLGQNVNLWNPGGAAPTSPQQYIATNPTHYPDPNATIGYVGPDSYPVSPSTYTTPVATAPTNMSARQYFDLHTLAQQWARMNPYAGEYDAASQAVLGEALNDVYVLPGVRPNVGYIPDVGAIHLNNLLPYDAWENSDRDLYPVENALTTYFSDLDATPFPKFMDVAGDMVRSEGLAFPGGGFEYSGERTPEQAALEDQILAGNITPQTVMAYDEMMKPRIEAVSYKSDLDKAVDIIAPIGLAAAMTLMAPYAAPVAWGTIGAAAFGAGAGALSSGIFSKWDDPLAIGLGAAGGALGGWGGQAAGNALGNAAGLGETGVRAATGVGGGLGGATGSYLGQSAASGFNNFDPGQLATAAITGATAGGVAGYTDNPFVGKATSAALGGVSDIFGNSTRRRRSPY